MMSARGAPNPMAPPPAMPNMNRGYGGPNYPGQRRGYGDAEYDPSKRRRY